MSLTAVISSITNAADAAKKVFELSQKMRNVELKTTIADLMNALADAKMQLAELKDETNALRAENAALKTAKAEGKPKMKWGCYQFEGEEGLYCPTCWEKKGKKYQTARAMHGQHYKCSVCGAMHPTG